MPTSRAFAFNTGTTISGTEQVGSIAVNSATTLSGNVVWWAGPDEDLGYVVAQAVSGGTMTGANGLPAYLGFYRSTQLNTLAFLSLANYIAQGQQVFTSGAVAKSWLNSNGYWTSYVFNGLSTISTNGDNAFGMGLDASGNLFTWGNNDVGQLGRNSTQSTFIPVSVCGAKKTFCKISAGYNFATAIDKNGQIWTWGSSSTAQLGNNSSANSKSTPSKISGAQKTFCNIATLFTSTFVLAIDKYGQVWSWGGGFASGQLGNNSTLPASTPVSVCGAKKTFCQVVANQQTSYGLDQYGQVWSWGGGVQGSLGNNSIVSYSTPISICGAKKTFCQITIAAAIDKYGQVWCWGSNLSGFLGNNSTVSTSTPVSVCGARKTFCSIATFPNTHAAIDNYGRLWVWGSNSDYVIGSSSSSTPILIEGGTKTFCKVFGTGRVGFAQTYNNINWSWGKNSFGVRAIGFAMPNLTPVAICGATKTFCKINMRNFATFGITSTGKLYSWGSNTSGVLGTNDSTAICRQTPVSIYNFANTYCVVSTAPTSTVYAIDNTGLVWSWGAGGLGQLGINSTDLRCTPGSILGLRKTFCKIEGGSNFVLGLDKNGLIWAWGQGIFGKLGIGAAANRSTPVSVCGALKTFCHIAASTSNGYGIDKYGQVWAWGVATSGQLGDNQIVTAANTPISVCGVKKTFCQISAGQLMVAAIDKYGQVWTWGSNNVGQLGNNSTSNASTPVSICGNKKTFCKIFTAGTIVAAIDNYGKFWSWGDNTFGSFGNQLSNQNASTPISVCGAVKTFCEIATSITDGSVAIDKNGIIWSWGQDLYGQLGHNYTFRTPLMICE